MLLFGERRVKYEVIGIFYLILCVIILILMDLVLRVPSRGDIIDHLNQISNGLQFDREISKPQLTRFQIIELVLVTLERPPARFSFVGLRKIIREY